MYTEGRPIYMSVSVCISIYARCTEICKHTNVRTHIHVHRRINTHDSLF
jgi:hypothetical protein